MTHSLFPAPLLAGAALAVPATYLLAALLPARPHQSGFGRAELASVLALALAALVGVGGLVIGPQVVGPGLLDVGGDMLAVRLDPVTSLGLGLVTFVGWVIVRFSRTYIEGDPGQRRYGRWLLAVLAAVTLLVSANHLLTLALAWTSTSLALHQLLTHFADRWGAQMAAHQKFLVSRTADVALLLAVGLLGATTGTLALDGVLAAIPASPAELSPGLSAAALLLVGCVALKSAQLPFHGWLTQVMEAPTPVSALLHAGVVNIGGLVLVRLAALLEAVPAAQIALVAVGTGTAVVAALVMSTQPSIKGRLAWSTMAQMGFMLVQCGLGAYALALLHLVAHSLYKAHAFLTSGSTVDRWRLATLAPPSPRPGLSRWLDASMLAGLLVTTLAFAMGALPTVHAEVWALGGVVAIAIAPLLVRADRPARRLPAALGAAALVGTWLLLHEAFGALLPAPAGSEEVPVVRLAIVGTGFALAFAVQATLAAHPAGTLARSLDPHLRAVLYLDELFARLTNRVWPPRLPHPPARLPES